MERRRTGRLAAARSLAAAYLDNSRGAIPRASDMDAAEQWALRQQMAWRAKIVNGSLHLKLLTAASRWAERSSVARLLLLALQHRSPPLPDLDVIYVHNDRDISPDHGQLPLVLTNAHAHGHSSLPVPDFSWLGWYTHTPPWCELARQLRAAAEARPWARRIDRAVFRGSLSNGKPRKRLKTLLASSADARQHLDVRHVRPTFLKGSTRPSSDVPSPLVEACNYKYALSVPGYGYANRLKSLLQCGAVVIHVAAPWNEFFFPMLGARRYTGRVGCPCRCIR